MTDDTRDTARPAPTCPLCATNDQIQRHAGAWLCFACWTVFSGSQGEWARWAKNREIRSSMYAAAAKDHADA